MSAIGYGMGSPAVSLGRDSVWELVSVSVREGVQSGGSPTLPTHPPSSGANPWMFVGLEFGVTRATLLSIRGIVRDENSVGSGLPSGDLSSSQTPSETSLSISDASVSDDPNSDESVSARSFVVFERRVPTTARPGHPGGDPSEYRIDSTLVSTTVYREALELVGVYDCGLNCVIQQV